MTQVQIDNKPLRYVNNAVVSWASNTTLSVSATSQERDSTNAYDIVQTSAITINGAINGAGGLDTGSLAANTWYYVYALGDSRNYKTGTYILSTSATTPLLPFDYDVYKFISVWRTNGSSQFILSDVIGNGNQRVHYYRAEISVLSAGSATAYAAVSLAGAVPPITNTAVIMTVSFTPNVAGEFVEFRPTGSASTANPRLSGVVAAQPQIAQMKVLSKVSSGNASIDYQNSAASGATTLTITGFEYYI